MERLYMPPASYKFRGSTRATFSAQTLATHLLPLEKHSPATHMIVSGAYLCACDDAPTVSGGVR